MAGSTLLIQDLFEREDPRFLGELYASDAEKKLKAFGARWAADARPFARAALLAYIADGCDRPHHRPLVKKLFKELEGKGDDEAMGAFMVAFDRLVKRKLVEGVRYSPATRSYEPRTRLVQVEDDDDNEDNDEDRFSTRTRRYLKRRAWRYFRVLGHRDPERYGHAIREALARYEDPDVATPAAFLDAWGLVHALYHGSPVLDRRPRGVVVTEGASLADLAPAPIYPEAWQDEPDAVLSLALHARSRPVRVFAIGLLKRDYAAQLARLPAKGLVMVVRSQHDEVAAFGAELLPKAPGLDALLVGDWLMLLEAKSEAALDLVCSLVAERVRVDRVTLDQAVDLACARPTRVAELGLRWVQEKPADGDAGLASLSRLVRAENARARAEGVRYYVAKIEATPGANAQRVRDLFDAKGAEVRAEAAALVTRSPRFRDDTALWGALAESPWADARAFLLKHLGERQKALLADERRHLWASTLLAVSRGSRDKRLALSQISDRIAQKPAEAEALLPLLAIALRSVRETERRAALAAVARAAFRAPALKDALERAVPELSLAAVGAAE
ncbi:MAG TPA: hypothetical protein VGM56_08570 [Byssovorax sp.]